MIHIIATNHSADLADDDVETICTALTVQANSDITSAWGLAKVSILPRTATTLHGWQLLFLDDSDQANALGYHDDLANGGLPVMKVFVRSCFAAGISPSACASHELAEALVDPYLNTASFDGRSKFWATEVGDPAQPFTYTVNGIELQDFVTPAWFQPNPPAGVKFSHTGMIHQPFEVPKGGYAQFLNIYQLGKGWQQVGAELGAGHNRPERRHIAIDQETA